MIGVTHLTATVSTAEREVLVVHHRFSETLD